MSTDSDPYDAKRRYSHEASNRPPMSGRYGGPDEQDIEGEALEVTPEIRERGSYLSPYRMDHIAELHSDRAAARELGKTLFPADWSDDKMFEAAQSVASDPSSRWTRGDDDFSGEPDTLFNPWHKMSDVEFAIPARFRVDGTFDGVKLRVIVEPYGEGIISAYTLTY
ncbi:EndoU domain-containing protein [Kribbella sp. NPDC056345]|uniref:EndoU domain-containing protein n=1 Tax=Kribbella sp. NPDC056345 TaxID=3345789 RepID=UPI0035E20813